MQKNINNVSTFYELSLSIMGNTIKKQLEE